MKKFISNFHNPLIEALKNFKGEEFTTREIKKLILKKFPELKDKMEWIQPSDHCINITNKRSASNFLNWEGEDRVRRFLEIVDLLFSEGIETEDDLRHWLKNNTNLFKLTKIKKEAGLKVSGYDEAKCIINLTADLMNVKRSYLDHSIWKHIGGGNQPACNWTKDLRTICYY